MSRDAEAECPVGYVEGHEDDGEYHARVLVYVTASHSEHGVGRVQQVGMHLEITRIFKYLKLLVMSVKIFLDRSQQVQTT